MKHKFRAWDKRFKKMDYGGGDLLLRINTYDYSEPMQYTGTDDKQEQEIYEGDILELVKYSVKYLEATNRIYTRYSEVIFLDGAYRLVNLIEKIGFKDGTKSIYELFDIGFYDTKKYYIKVGNIFQNPELLEIK